MRDVLWGFNELHDRVGTMHPGEVVAVTGAGTSAFVRSVAVVNAVRGARVTYCDLQNVREVAESRIVSALTAVRAEQIGEAERRRHRRLIDMLSSTPLEPGPVDLLVVDSIGEMEGEPLANLRELRQRARDDGHVLLVVLPVDDGSWTSLVDLHLEIRLPESVSDRPDHRDILVRKFRRGPAGWRATVMPQVHYGRMIDPVPEGDPGPDPFRIREPLSDDLNWVRTTDSGLSSILGSEVHSELEGHRGQSVDELGLREALEALDINVWEADLTVTVEQCDDPGLSDADLLVGDGQDHHVQSNCTVRVTFSARDVAVSRVLEGLVWGTVDHLAQVTSLDVSNLLVVDPRTRI
ncbi:hypothetical protein SAMN06295981_0427 [Corynebacterium pollutisoli]|uniref:Uncharacterized protein n=1 Tax=Corynebacterium pollutisoli TaxID=1610489 RepID=A0A1X7I6G6_9CORY|nr:hypothetical protein [Corynebacterium pollutisoli]SMG09482.1 hypothetical protein SAMN06295981_0427 [Corynebacterium pollutisoli]